MTIQAAPSEQSYAADGVSTVFAIPFPFDTSADLKLTSTDTSGNILTLSTGFTISGGGGSTGKATFLVAPAVGLTITIYDNPALTQPTDYVSLDAFPAESHERALDRVTRIAKRLYQLVQRSVRFPDGDVSTDGVLGSVANRKGKYLFFNAVTGAIEYAVSLVTTALSQSIIGQLLNPQTLAEAAASVTPTNLAYVPGDARRYGWLSTNTAAQNATALTTTITALNNLGGLVTLPVGTFALNPVVIPQFVTVRGSSKRGTILTHTNASGEALFTLGGTSGTLYYGCGLTDLSILLTGTAGTCVLAQGTCGAEIARLYLEGETVSAGRTTKGVVIDGSNASAFFNAVRDVQTNHLHSGFGQKTSGSLNPTQNYFTNCQAFGDVATDTTSEGVAHGDGINSGVGQLSVYEHCNFENCGTGMHFYGFCGPAVHVGCRFEGGTLDVLYDLNASAQTFVGGNPGLTTGLVTNNSLANSNYIGGWAGSNAAVYSQFGLVRAQAGAITDVNYRADMWAAQTGNISEIRNSSTTLVGGVSPSLDNLTPVQRIFGVRSISGTITPANNLRGTANFAAATTVAVAFTVNEPDAGYTVSLGGNLAGFCWVTSKATTGFTINCSASNSNPTDWHLIR